MNLFNISKSKNIKFLTHICLGLVIVFFNYELAYPIKPNTAKNHPIEAVLKPKINKKTTKAKSNKVASNKIFEAVEHLHQYSQVDPGQFPNKNDFIPISDLKLGVILVSAFFNQDQIWNTIIYAIRSNFLDGCMDPNHSFQECYSFPSEFKKSNFTLVNKKLFAYFNKNRITQTHELISQDIYDIAFEDFKAAILNEEGIDCLLSVRGGYGAAKMLNQFYQIRKPSKEKLLIGYSDVTALHLFLSQEWNWKTIHGPMLKSFSEEDVKAKNFSQDNMRKLILLLASKKPVKINIGLVPVNDLAHNARCIKGVVTGGNASIIQNSIGTKWQINSGEKILIMEDTGLPYYQVDRLMLHLKQAKIFDKVSAVILGVFDNSRSGVSNLNIKEFEALAKIINVPVFITDRIGHGRYNYPFIVNLEGGVFRNKDGHFIFEQIYQNPFNKTKVLKP